MGGGEGGGKSVDKLLSVVIERKLGGGVGDNDKEMLG